MCIEKVVFHESEEKICTIKCVNLQGYREKAYSRRICIMEVRIFPISKREHPPTIKAKKARSTEKPVAKSSRRLKSGDIDFRIQGLPHSTGQKEDDVRRETVRRLTHQFETHPHCESLMPDLNKNQKFNLFSEESEEIDPQHGKHRVYRAVRDHFNAQIVRCIGKKALCIVRAANACGFRKDIDKHLNKERYDVLSVPNYVIKKNPSHGARHGPTERQRIYYKAHDMLRQGLEEEVQHHFGKIPKKILFFETH